MSSKITIKDIAQKSGISTGTVDRVLHNRGNVAPDVVARVMEVIEQIGYEPNIMARSLANNKKPLRIAVILPDYRTDPYWAQPKEGAEWAAASVKHYGLSVEFHYFPLFQPKNYLKLVRLVLATKPDGILTAPIFQKEAQYLLSESSALKIPLVIINTFLDHPEILSYIGQDSYQSGILAGRLLNFGLRDGDHVMVLNLDKEVQNARHLLDKERGFKDFFETVTNKNIGIHAAIFEDFDDLPKMQHWLKTQFDQNPNLNGFFITNSRAYKLVEGLDEATQNRVKIVGFDLIAPNLSLLAEGKIRFLINQNAWHQGYLGIMTFVNSLIMRKETPRTQYLPLDIIVNENVEYYLKRTLEMPMMVV